MKTSHLPSVLASILLATFSLHAAHAQAPAPHMVTRDELRTCMNSQADLATRRQAIEARAKVNREAADAIRAEGDELTSEGQKLAAANEPMDRLNRKMRAHNNRATEAKTVEAAFNSDLDVLNKAVLTYNKECSNITFMTEDREAILKERAEK